MSASSTLTSSIYNSSSSSSHSNNSSLRDDTKKITAFTIDLDGNNRSSRNLQDAFQKYREFKTVSIYMCVLFMESALNFNTTSS